VNSYNIKSDEFNSLMSREHRTLQQSFTRLCLEWIEYVASENYHTDLRNEQSHKISKKLVESFKREIAGEMNLSGITLEEFGKPSQFLPLI